MKNILYHLVIPLVLCGVVLIECLSPSKPVRIIGNNEDACIKQIHHFKTIGTVLSIQSSFIQAGLISFGSYYYADSIRKHLIELRISHYKINQVINLLSK